MLELVVECIKALFRIGMLVRKSTPRDRFQRALQYSRSTFYQNFDINYVEEKYAKLNREDSRWLATRLGSANAKRRQFIKYGQEHQAHLDVDETQPKTSRDRDRIDVAASDSIDVPSARVPSERVSSKATTFALPRETSKFQLLNSGVTEEEEDDVVSLMTASTAFDSERNLKLPSLEVLSPNGEPFECPICFTLQTFRREKTWK